MQVRKHKRRRYAAPVGALSVLLAVIGLVAIVVFSIRLTQRALDNTPEKKHIENTIRPVTMWDPVPFENPADIDATQLLYYSMWSVLLGENRSQYTVNDNQELVIPASDLDVAATSLFGPAVHLEHNTFGELDVVYFYDVASDTYHVPTSAQLYVYSPQVDTVEKMDDNLFLVRVGYTSPQGVVTVNQQGDATEAAAEKYMLYVLRKNGSDYQIVAVRDDYGNMGNTVSPEEAAELQ